jgi:hypothetical protein
MNRGFDPYVPSETVGLIWFPPLAVASLLSNVIKKFAAHNDGNKASPSSSATTEIRSDPLRRKFDVYLL